MLGVVSDPGIIPRCVKTLFKRISDEKESAEKENLTPPEHKVTFSYLEIYNEKVSCVFCDCCSYLPQVLDQFKLNLGNMIVAPLIHTKKYLYCLLLVNRVCTVGNFLLTLEQDAKKIDSTGNQTLITHVITEHSIDWADPSTRNK